VGVEEMACSGHRALRLRCCCPDMQGAAVVPQGSSAGSSGGNPANRYTDRPCRLAPWCSATTAANDGFFTRVRLLSNKLQCNPLPGSFPASPRSPAAAPHQPAAADADAGCMCLTLMPQAFCLCGLGFRAHGRALTESIAPGAAPSMSGQQQRSRSARWPLQAISSTPTASGLTPPNQP
jgi:hypothetical protein